MQGHTTSGEDGGCGEKAKQHKFKIIAFVVFAIVCIILGVTLTGGKDPTPGPGPKPGPTPPTPPTPAPIDSGYNPYYLDETSVIK